MFRSRKHSTSADAIQVKADVTFKMEMDTQKKTEMHTQAADAALNAMR